MDEDSDVERELDNSLLDLHHGLDSSTEDYRVDDTDADRDVCVGNGRQPMNLPAQHVNMLEDMVQEMRHGLQAAVEELAKLQVREEGERGDRQVQQRQQRQLDDLTENVSDLKNQMNSVTKCLETIQRESSKMREDYAVLTKFVKDTKGDGMTHLSDHSFEWSDKLPENPFDTGNEIEDVTFRESSSKDNDEVTAVACKSLSLTQALHLNLSMTSEEEEEVEEPEMRRLSHFTPTTTTTTTTTTHQGGDTNRRHSLPASTTPRGGNSNVMNAAQRRKAVKELTDSECDYCSQLWTLIETYCSSLQNAGFLSHDQLEVLFPSYLEKLYEQHCVIYSNLQDKLVHWSYLTVVSDLLSCITDTHNPYSLLSMYREYSENLPDAVSCLRSALTHSTELKALLKTIQQSSYQNDDLMTLIKAPAQHLPKYLLQLQQICKYTPSTHPDYLLLRTSLSRLRLFVEQMNIGINNAIQTSTSQDFRPGSSNDSSQVLSARDSGNISNEDELLSARTLFKSEQCLLSEDMPDDPYHLSVHGNTNQANNRPAGSSYYGRQQPQFRGMPRAKTSNMNTLSHPDLSRINHSPLAQNNSAPFSLPPSGLAQGWRNGMEGRQAGKNNLQMKRGLPVQPAAAGFLHPDPNHHHNHLLSTSRPSSAIDFTTNGYNNHNNISNSISNSISNGYPVPHYPGTNYPRPRSAMGPLDSHQQHHRPTIISRKHMRRSQPPLANSGYWADVDSQQHLSKHSQQKMPFSPHDLLPSRPSPLLPYNSHEDDEEDDTRASDSFSCVTSSSHQHSSGRGSNHEQDHDIDLDFLPLASDRSPFRDNGNNNNNKSKQFTEDDVAVILAQELLSDDNGENGKELEHIGMYDEDNVNGRKTLQEVQNKSYRQPRVNESKPKTNAMEKNILVPKQQSSYSKFQNKRNHTMTEPPSSDESRGFESFANKDRHSSANGDVGHSSPHQNPHEERNVRDSRVNGGHKEQALTKDQPNNYDGEEDKRLKNQNFLLSLTHSPRSTKSIETTFHTRDSHPDSSRYNPEFRSPVSTVDDNEKQDKHYPTNNTTNKAPVSSSQTSHSKVVRRSAPLLISHTSNGTNQPREHESVRVSSPAKSSTSNGTLQTDLDNSVTSGVSSRSYTRTPPPPPQPSSSLSLAAALSTEVSSERKPSRNTNRQNGDDEDSNNLMTRSLDLSEVLNSGDSNPKLVYDRRKKMKNGGDVDSLPRASDDPVNARKKMHLKSSIKNLFTKKRGKVILADVEREVILEMASAVVSASTSPSSSSLNMQKFTPVVDSNSPHTGNQKCESSGTSFNTISNNKESVNSMTPNKELNKLEKQRSTQKVQRIPASAFEIKCKKDKGSSTSSPLKVWRPCSYIQPSDNQAKSVHRLSLNLNPDSLPQSPCTYQEKLLKERLNIQGNPDLEQKPLIHPKFLLSSSSRVPKDNEKGCLPIASAFTCQPIHAIPCNNSSNVTLGSSPESLMVVSKEKHSLQEDKACKKEKENNVCKATISKYEESEKKQIKAKMKAYAHMKKHILNYESHEAEAKERDDNAMKKTQEKNNAKQIKQKVECPKCQNKSLDGWKHLEQTPGKSFHIQAYKAYKNKNRESVNVDKQEVDASHPKEQHVQQQSMMIKSDTASSQSSMHFLKPCEDVIAFHETSRNPQMTSSYPMALQERKLKKKNFAVKEPLIHKPNARIDDGDSKTNANERSLRDNNMLSLSSGIFYDGECFKPQNDCITKTGNDIPTNDLSHPTNTPMSYNAHNVPKPHCFNVLPASVATSNAQTQSSSNQNKRHSYVAGSCVNNILKMSKDELLEYERNRPLLKESKGKSDLKKIITNSSSGKECVSGDATSLSNSTNLSVLSDARQKQYTATDVKDDEKETENFCIPKEEKDYFDYTYRLCYVDCSKYDGDLSSCTNCSVDENGLEKETVTDTKSFSCHLKNKESSANNKIQVDTSAVPKRNKQDACSINVDKALQIETKACSELNKWLSNLNNPPPSVDNNKALVSSTPANPPNERMCPPHQYNLTTNPFYNNKGLLLSSPTSNVPKEKALSSSSSSNQNVTADKLCCLALAQKMDPSLSSTATHGQTSSCAHSISGSGCKGSSSTPSTTSQRHPNKCLMHYPELARQPVSTNSRYNCRNSSTLETFSPSMTQPIFSVLPIEGYHIDNNQLPVKNGSYACQKPYESHSTNQAFQIPHSSKPQDDAVARRALKQRVKSKEAARLSTCSIQSANEIHILKLHNFGDIQQCSVESESQAKQHTKESSSCHKNSDPVSTLQVRYIPKQFGSSSKQNKVQTTAHAQIKRDSGCVNGIVTNMVSNHQGAMRHTPPSSGVCHNIAPQASYDQNAMSASGAFGPDLLQVSVVQPGASNKSDPSDQHVSSTTPPKKQSFFARFTHSPLSIFYKDAKSNGSK